MKPKKTVVAFDIGTSKTCAVIAGYFGTRDGWKILGQGFAPSSGIKKGRILQPTAVHGAMEKALHHAIQAAKTSPTEAIVALPASVCKTLWREETRTFYAARKVNDNDVHILTKKFPVLPRDSKNRLIKTVIHQYRCDDKPWTTKIPVGTVAKSVTASGTVFYFDEADAVQWHSALDTFPFTTVHFSVASEALAAHIRVRHPELTSWLQFDLGAGLTQVSLVKHDHVLRQGATIVAGNHVLHDLMYGVNIELPEARRLLHEQGQADGQSHEEEMIQVLGEDGAEKTTVSRAYMFRIIHARIRELFSFLQEEMTHWTKEGFELPDTIVLDGGLSLLVGIDDVVQKLFNKQVKLLHAAKNIAAHTAEGLLRSEVERITPQPSFLKRRMAGVGKWFREFI